MASKGKLNLVINPGSTSTKLGVFDKREKLKDVTIRHSEDELKPYTHIYGERAFRTELIIRMLHKLNYSLEEFGGVVAIAGRIKPAPTCVYRVNEAMLRDLREAKYNEHTSNLGACLAKDIADKLGTDAYVAYAVTVDEMAPVAKLSGMPEIERHGATHTINQKRMAQKAAKELGLSYEECKLVVVHLGGGISVVAHRFGRMVDGNIPIGEGPFCIDRTGSVNCFELVKLCFSGKYTKDQMLRKVRGGGGVSAYLHTRNFKEVVDRMKAGDEMSTRVFDAMAYQVAKEIGSAAVAVGGSPNAIVLTGGMANSTDLVVEISRQVSFLGKIIVYPGEKELESLANALADVQEGLAIPVEYEEG